MKRTAGLLIVTSVWLAAAATGAVAAFLADKLLHGPLPAKRPGGFDDESVRDVVAEFATDAVDHVRTTYGSLGPVVLPVPVRPDLHVALTAG